MGADEMYFSNDNASVRNQSPMEIDRSIEKEIDDVMGKLGAIKSRLRSIHIDLEILASHKPGENFYVQLAGRSAYPPDGIVEEIKEKMVNTLLKEKKFLHDEYRKVLNTPNPIDRYRVLHGKSAWHVQDTDRTVEWATIAICNKELDAYEIANSLNHKR